MQVITEHESSLLTLTFAPAPRKRNIPYSDKERQAKPQCFRSGTLLTGFGCSPVESSVCEKCVNFVKTFLLPFCYPLPTLEVTPPVSRLQGAVMKANLSTHSRYPAQRAFVVQIAQPTPGDEDVPLGRAEHLVSGQTMHFAVGQSSRSSLRKS